MAAQAEAGAADRLPSETPGVKKYFCLPTPEVRRRAEVFKEVIEMEKPKYHILVCASFRVSGDPQGVCFKRGSTGFLQYLQEGLSDRDMNDVAVSMTGCLKVCDRGPAMVIYPQNYWYRIENEDAIDEILDALEQGRPVDKYLIA